jgi:hypothetical protein
LSLEGTMKIPTAVLSILRAGCCLGLAQLVAFSSQARDHIEIIAAVAQAAAVPAAADPEASTRTLMLAGVAVALFLARRLSR